ncbi:hypothetical protein B0H14DRAFT_3603870, partial [Mycena olivaceomarginata]
MRVLRRRSESMMQKHESTPMQFDSRREQERGILWSRAATGDEREGECGNGPRSVGYGVVRLSGRAVPRRTYWQSFYAFGPEDEGGDTVCEVSPGATDGIESDSGEGTSARRVGIGMEIGSDSGESESTAAPRVRFEPTSEGSGAEDADTVLLDGNGGKVGRLSELPTLVHNRFELWFPVSTACSFLDDRRRCWDSLQPKLVAGPALESLPFLSSCDLIREVYERKGRVHTSFVFAAGQSVCERAGMSNRRFWGRLGAHYRAAASRQQDFGEAELKGAARVSRRHEPREAELKGAARVSRRQERWEAESEVAIQLHDFWAEGSEVAAVSLAPESSQAQENRMDWGFPIQTYLASLERGSRPEPTIDSGGDPGQQKTGAIQLYFSTSTQMDKKKNWQVNGQHALQLVNRIIPGSRPHKRAKDSGKEDSDNRPEGWLWQLGKLSKMSKDELDEWSKEGDRVQWFRAEAEMQRWQEQKEQKLAELLRTNRSFLKMEATWSALASDSATAGHRAYARQKAATYQTRAQQAQNFITRAGYGKLLTKSANIIERIQMEREKEKMFVIEAISKACERERE